MLNRYFPTFNLKNIGIYYLLGIFLHGWFILPNWVFYFSKYITLTQIGIVEGVAILVGVLMEVPSGALSDLFGKKKTIIFGSLVIILSCVVLIYAREFTHFLIGNVLMFIGFAFHSGATEAFAYDSMVEKKLEKNYDVVVSRHTSISIAATVFSTFIGGYLYGLNPIYPFVAWIIFSAVSVVLLIFAIEPGIDIVKLNFRNYIRHLGEGTMILFGEKLKLYLVTILGIAIFIKLYQGIVRQAIAADFTFTGETFGYLLGLIMIPTTLLSFKFDVLRKRFGDYVLLIGITSVMFISFTFALLAKNVIVGASIFFLLMLAEKLSQPLISVIVNQRIDSKHRATTLSALSLFSQIPYILLVFGFAYLTELKNIRILYIIYLVISGAILLSTLRLKQANNKS